MQEKNKIRLGILASEMSTLANNQEGDVIRIYVASLKNWSKDIVDIINEELTK